MPARAVDGGLGYPGWVEIDEPQPERRAEAAPSADAGGPSDADPGTAHPAGESEALTSASQPEEPHTALPPKMEAWRKRSAAGAILTGFALGLQEVLESRRDEPSIVIQTSGDPPDDLPVEADFEYGRPRQSVVNIRPWLLNDTKTDRPDADGGPAAGDTAGRS